MVENVHEMLEERPFVPFTIITTGAKEYRVPTADHAVISPPPRRVVVFRDNGAVAIIAGLHIAAVEKETSEPVQ